MKLIGIARLGRDAEVRFTTNGRAVANLSLAYNFGQKDNRKTQWVEAALWGDQAERLQQYLLKGTVLNVICRDVHIETFEGSNGTGHKLVGTVADIEFVPKQRESDDQQQTSQRPVGRQQKPVSSSFDDLEDDIPFAFNMNSISDAMGKPKGLMRARNGKNMLLLQANKTDF